MNIEDVDKTMDEISEAQDQMQQMNDVLAQPIGGAADFDEDELAAELAVRGQFLHLSLHSFGTCTWRESRPLFCVITKSFFYGIAVSIPSLFFHA